MRYGAFSRCNDMAIVLGLAPEELAEGNAPVARDRAIGRCTPGLPCSCWLMRSAFQL